MPDRQVDPSLKTEKVNSKTGLGWLAFACGVLAHVTLFSGGRIFMATHNAMVPFVVVLLLVIIGWSSGGVAIKNREYGPAVAGILLLFPPAALLLWVLWDVVIPFYVQWITGGWYSIP